MDRSEVTLCTVPNSWGLLQTKTFTRETVYDEHGKTSLILSWGADKHDGRSFLCTQLNHKYMDLGLQNLESISMLTHKRDEQRVLGNITVDKWSFPATKHYSSWPSIYAAILSLKKYPRMTQTYRNTPRTPILIEILPGVPAACISMTKRDK